MTYMFQKLTITAFYRVYPDFLLQNEKFFFRKLLSNGFNKTI